MRALVMEKRYVIVTPAGKRRITRCEKEGLCVACLQPMDGEKGVRGMHSRCSKATWRLINEGTTTEADRVAAGKMLEKAQPGRKPTNPVVLDILGEE